MIARLRRLVRRPRLAAVRAGPDRPSRSRRRLALEVGLASTIATFILLPIQASAAGGFAYDTYFTSAYERQIDSRTCVAA